VPTWGFVKAAGFNYTLLVMQTRSLCDTVMLLTKVESEATKNVHSILKRLLSMAESEEATDVTLDDLKMLDDQGDAVVHWAARLGRCRTLHRVLTSSDVACRASDVVSVRNQSGVTPLHEAADRGLRNEVEVCGMVFSRSTDVTPLT